MNYRAHNKVIDVCKKIFPMFLCALFLVSNMPVQADEKHEVVKVGWYYSDYFQEGMSDNERKSGYCYDYLQKVADYATWDYEYVYGTWSELLEKLENGEIDFLGGVSITQERKDTLLFPDLAMGTEEYYLYKNADDTSISASDLSTFENKKMGLIKDNLMSQYALQWIEENHLNIEVNYYDSFDEQGKALENKEVDLISRTMDNSKNLDGIKSTVKLGQEPYYLAVNKSRSDLLERLNSAISTMTTIDPYLLQNLQYENYGTSLANESLTTIETDWLNTHTTLKVGYLDEYLPYSSTDEDGNATGLMVDVLDGIFDKLDLDTTPTIQYQAYDSYEDILMDLKYGKIDVAFPVLDDLYQLEQEDIHATSEVVNDSGTLFYHKGIKKKDITTIAVNKNNALQIAYTKLMYPNAKIVYCSSVDTCLDAVVKNKADATIMDSLRTQYVTSNSGYDGLSYLQLSTGCGKCFGIQQGNHGILLLLNRGLKALGSNYGLDCAYQYMADLNVYTTLDFIKDHLASVSVICAIIISIVIVLLIQNIKNKQKQVEEAAELKKKAEIASESKSVFLFNMSHDIRTPMNAVLGYTALMEKELDNPGKMKDYLNKIRISGDYLLNLINNVLEVARIDSGREVVDEEFVDLLDERYSVILESEMEKKKQTFTKDLKVDHRYVFSDAQKIREIMLNLLSNAVKYTPEGGHIVMKLEERECSKPGYATYVASVLDDGIGMTKDFKEHIFESFTRERTTTESKIAGTGLGMSIVKKMTALLGGSVSVESELGKGSTFTVVVDFKIVDNPEYYLEKRKEKENPSLIDLSGRRILLAEDNELNAEIAKTLIENQGLSVDVVTDGVECVNAIVAHDAKYYDMILMDIQMPNLNGYGACRKIRQLEDAQKCSIPIVAMTANAFEEDKKEALQAGMNGHLAKPIDIERLMETLSEFLR
jgi:signal transduction histidine kinase/ABC-type amino acid transport substrate-binding protein/ActR/RegA family two-component response regulator